MTQADWFYEKDGRRAGPVGEAELISLLRCAALGGDTPVWRQGQAAWAPVNAVAELARQVPLPRTSPAPVAGGCVFPSVPGPSEPQGELGVRPKRYVGRCDNCRGIGLLRKHDQHGGSYCSDECRTFASHPGFCASCAAQTTSESCGSLIRINGSGSYFGEWFNRCPTCHSLIGRVHYRALFRTKKLGYYRVLFFAPDRYFSRRLREDLEARLNAAR